MGGGKGTRGMRVLWESMLDRMYVWCSKELQVKELHEWWKCGAAAGVMLVLAPCK